MTPVSQPVLHARAGGHGHSHSHENMVPRGALLLAGALVAFTLLLVLGVRLSGMPHAASPSLERAAAGAQVVAQRSLVFADAADGTVRVTDAASGAPVATFGAEGSGFVRGVLRGLARDRHMRGLGAAAPFRLTAWDDGALSLTDSATGRVIELGAFGPDNRAVFQRLLPVAPR